jgi:hypothetical protein
MSARQWNLDETVCIAVGVPVSEYAEGDGISMELNEDDWIVLQGHHGSIIRSKKPNNVATATLSIMPGSPTVEELQNAFDADLISGRGAGEFYFEDLNGSTTCVAPNSWGQKRMNIVAATEIGPVEVPITLANVQPHAGQNRLIG